MDTPQQTGPQTCRDFLPNTVGRAAPYLREYRRRESPGSGSPRALPS
jgi:hypothetical protein